MQQLETDMKTSANGFESSPPFNLYRTEYRLNVVNCIQVSHGLYGVLITANLEMSFCKISNMLIS